MRNFIIGLVVGLSLVTFSAQEKIALGTPITTAAPVPIPELLPDSLCLQVANALHPAEIRIGLVTARNTVEVFSYPNAAILALDTSAEVNTLVGQLNGANLSTRSLWRRVFDRLVADFPARFSGGGTVQ